MYDSMTTLRTWYTTPTCLVCKLKVTFLTITQCSRFVFSLYFSKSLKKFNTTFSSLPWNGNGDQNRAQPLQEGLAAPSSFLRSSISSHGDSNKWGLGLTAAWVAILMRDPDSLFLAMFEFPSPLSFTPLSYRGDGLAFRMPPVAASPFQRVTGGHASWWASVLISDSVGELTCQSMQNDVVPSSGLLQPFALWWSHP